MKIVLVSDTIQGLSTAFDQNKEKIANRYKDDKIPASIDPIIQVPIFFDRN